MQDGIPKKGTWILHPAPTCYRCASERSSATDPKRLIPPGKGGSRPPAFAGWNIFFLSIHERGQLFRSRQYVQGREVAALSILVVLSVVDFLLMLQLIVIRPLSLT
jgi:hypothetical protein